MYYFLVICVKFYKSVVVCVCFKKALSIDSSRIKSEVNFVHIKVVSSSVLVVWFGFVFLGLLLVVVNWVIK